MIVADVADCYRKHSDALVRFAASQVGWNDADDVVAAAVLGVLGRAGAADAPVPPQAVDDLRAYLYRSVANAAAKHWRTLDRRRRRDTQAFALSTSAWGETEPDARAMAVVAALSTRGTPSP